MRETINSNKYVQVAIFVLAVLLSAFMLVRFFEQIPTEGTTLGIDWIYHDIKNGTLRYDIIDGIRNPPWSLLPILWLGFLSEKAGWGMLVYINMLTLIVSVPQVTPKWLSWVAILFLVTSFPALRTSADANLEILVTMGALLLVWGYRIKNPLILAAGILIITAKPQSSLLILIVLAFYMLQTWSQRKILLTGVAVLLVVIPTFIWRGEDWLKAVDGTYQRESIIDISLNAALIRTEVVSETIRWILRLTIAFGTLYLVWLGQRTISREKAGLLIAASLLIAPYSAGNSTLAVLAIGIIPLFLASPRLGLPLLIMIDVLYLFRGDFRYNNESYFLTTWLLLTWGILAWRVYQFEVIQPQPLQPTENAIAA